MTNLPEAKPELHKAVLTQNKFVCIEYPGHVKNIDRVLETLGGENAIATSLETNKPLELRYRPKDPFCHPMLADNVPFSGLLVKVTRRKKKNQPDDTATLKTEIVGLVPQILRFRGMADFQYLVPKNEPMRQIREGLGRANVETILNFRVRDNGPDYAPLATPPPLFCTLETPFDYKYRQSKPLIKVRVRQPDGTYAVKLVDRSKDFQKQTSAGINWNQPTPTTSKWSTLRLTGDEKRVCEIVGKLFEERPIWTHHALKAQLSPEDVRHSKRALYVNAYTFRSGVWKKVWIRVGVDPRSDPSYHIYQIVDIQTRFKQSILNLRPKSLKRKGHPANESTERTENEQGELPYIFDGKNAKVFTRLMLCDITDPDILPLINNPAYRRNTFSPATGFYYGCVLQRIRNAVLEKLKINQSGNKGQGLQDIEKGLEEEIAKEKANIEKMKERGPDLIDLGEENSSGDENLTNRMLESLRRLQELEGSDSNMDLDALQEYDFDSLLARDSSDDEDTDDEDDPSMWEIEEDVA